MPHRAGTTAERIRYGLTGLAIAFIIILLGSAIIRSSRDNDPPAVTEQNAVTNEPSEPLAELGVAPGSKASDESANTTANQ